MHNLLSTGCAQFVSYYVPVIGGWKQSICNIMEIVKFTIKYTGSDTDETKVIAPDMQKYILGRTDM